MKIDDAIKIIDALIEGIYPVYGLCAWQTVKEELAQQTNNKQSVPFVDCDKCGEIAEHHFCSECLESYTN